MHRTHCLLNTFSLQSMLALRTSPQSTKQSVSSKEGIDVLYFICLFLSGQESQNGPTVKVACPPA